MPLTEPRLSDPFKIVYLKDSALDAVPENIMYDYERERNFSILEQPNEAEGWAGIASMKEQPTVFTVAPLHPDDDHLAFQPGADQYKTIVQRHLIAAANTGIPARAFKTNNGRTMLDRETFDKWLPTEWVYDLVIPIIKRGQEAETPLFGLRGTWLVERSQRKRRRLAHMADAGGVLPAGQTDSD